jgi:argininosuccinate lyase
MAEQVRLSIGEGTRIMATPSSFIADHLHAMMTEPDDLLFGSFSRVNRAHVVMMEEKSVLAPEAAAALLKALVELDAKGHGGLSQDYRKGEMLTHVEQYVMDACGIEIGGNLHLGRSRGDIYPATYRLYIRTRLLDLALALIELRGELLKIARTHVETIMPSYTHMQQAQAVTFGHYLTGILSAFERDTTRVFQLYPRANLNALGVAVGAGSSWPLDRRRTAELMGCGGLVQSAFDGTYFQDYMVETTSLCAGVTSNHLILLLDLYNWTSDEFGYIDLGDEFCLSSSIMPQKRNPLGFEIIRSTCSRVYGYLVELLTTEKAENAMERVIFGFPPTKRALATTIDMLRFQRAIVPTITFNAQRALENAEGSFVGAAELAYVLTRKAGASFREAHRVVGTMVRLAVERGIRPVDVGPDLIAEASQRTLGRELTVSALDIAAAFEPKALLNSLATEGSANPREVERTIGLLAAQLEADVATEKLERERLAAADRKLEAEVARRLGAR